MKHEIITKYVLSEFNVKHSNNGYNYIIYGIHLIHQNPNTLNHITKTLYIDIANQFSTSITCVERGIRTTVETIWSHRNDNLRLFLKIFGSNHTHRPTNTIFFKLLYEYIDTIDSAKCRLENLTLSCHGCIFAQKYISELGKYMEE